MSKLIAVADTLDLYQAGGGKLPGVETGVTPDTAQEGFFTFIGGMMSAIMVLAALMLLLYMLWGAISWITSGGDNSKVQQARDRITQAVIGIIVLAAVTALFMIVQSFLGLDILDFGPYGGGRTGGGIFGSGGASSGLGSSLFP